MRRPRDHTKTHKLTIHALGFFFYFTMFKFTSVKYCKAVFNYFKGFSPVPRVLSELNFKNNFISSLRILYNVF